MPFDEDGREYKECISADCKRKYYRDDKDNRHLNDYNWEHKVFCSRKCKSMTKNPFFRETVKARSADVKARQDAKAAAKAAKEKGTT